MMDNILQDPSRLLHKIFWYHDDKTTTSQEEMSWFYNVLQLDAFCTASWDAFKTWELDITGVVLSFTNIHHHRLIVAFVCLWLTASLYWSRDVICASSQLD